MTAPGTVKTTFKLGIDLLEANFPLPEGFYLNLYVYHYDHPCFPSCLRTYPNIRIYVHLLTLQTTCVNGYRHNHIDDSPFWSLVAEHDWVCDDASRGANLIMAQNIGIVVNGLIFMQLSDK